jgi:hypothetical protein
LSKWEGMERRKGSGGDGFGMPRRTGSGWYGTSKGRDWLGQSKRAGAESRKGMGRWGLSNRLGMGRSVSSRGAGKVGLK